MHTFYGLVVSLIVLEAFVIQSDAVGPADSEKVDYFNRNYVKIRTEMLAKQFRETGINATRKGEHSPERLSENVEEMIEIFENHILEIDAATTNSDPEENSSGNYNKTDRIYFHFESYAEVKSLFEKFGQHARRISIDYDEMDATIRRDINKNIVNKYANQFIELYISVYDEDCRIWEEMSNENGQLKFPIVKKFVFKGICGCSRFDLNKIFPQLESVKLYGDIGNPNCLTNVRNLKKLGLSSFSDMISIQESQYEDILKKNREITWLSIIIQKKETLQFIEEYLKNLQTLKIENAHGEFLIGNDHVYNLETVTSFVVVNYFTSQLGGFMSLRMPNLKRLKLNGLYIDKQTSDFINHFENLDTVHIEPDTFFYGVAYLGTLKYVKQYITAFFCDDLLSLEDFFYNFDEAESKLESLKLICIGNTISDKPEEIMNEINHQLMISDKPTWTVEENEENNRKYLIIKRHSCKYVCIE